MRKIFNISDYPGKYAMHCDTEEKAKVFCEYLDSVGRRWCTGCSYTSHANWGDNKSEHCYNFNNGESCSKDYYKYNGYAILEFDDFEFVHGVGRTGKQITVKNVIFNPPATIVNWSDGTNTVVKCDRCRGKSNGECKHCMERSSHWKENGLSCAFAKKAFGNEYFEAVKKYCE